MAQLVVRNLQEQTKQRLKARADENGRSLEAEVRSILDASVASVPNANSGGFGSLLAEQFTTMEPVPDETWEEFHRNMAELRNEWRVRDVELDDATRLNFKRLVL